MNCDCGAETEHALCDSCMARAVRRAQIAAMLNSQKLLTWVLENTANPGEGILSLLTAAIRLHNTFDVGVEPFPVWVERSGALVQVFDLIASDLQPDAPAKAPS